jgi:hypothetical protein
LGVPDRADDKYANFTANSVYDKMMFMVKIHPFIKRKTIDECRVLIPPA